MAIIYSHVTTRYYHKDDADCPIWMSINAGRTEEAEKAELEERRNRSTNMSSAWSEIELRREAEWLHSKYENEKQQSLSANPKYANVKRSEYLTIPG